jgi:hypothetical protein
LSPGFVSAQGGRNECALKDRQPVLFTDGSPSFLYAKILDATLSSGEARVTRYLILIVLAGLAACTYSTSSEQHGAAAFPETRTAQIAVSEVRDPARFTLPGDGDGLSGFVSQASLVNGDRVRLRNFEVLYHAPNRYPGVAAPYLPTTVPDRLMITLRDEVFIEESIPAEFAGTVGNRTVEAAQFDIKDKHYLLVTTGGAARNPRWFAIFNDSGKLLYRAATTHGGYRFARQADGITMIDDAGYGKRFSVL